MKQIKFIPFTNSLTEYLSQHNNMDVCADTYPYSGTTTTCASLLMGLGSVTIYNPKKLQHVSNVTGGLLIHSLGFENSSKYLCNNIDEYIRKLVNMPKTNLEERITIRERFLNSMNPELFMEGYESLLKSLN